MEKLLLSNKESNILVIGDIMLDRYINVTSNKISAEIEIPVYLEKDSIFRLGGAANVCSLIKKINKKTEILGLLGNDNYSSNLIELFDSNNIKHNLFKENRKNTVKTRYFSKNNQLFRSDYEDNYSITNDTEENIIKFLEENIIEFDLIVISDYNKGLLTKTLTEKIISLSNKYKLNTYIDPVINTDYEKYKNCTFFKPNLITAEKITGVKKLEKITGEIFLKINPKKLIITLSEKGYFFSDNEKTHIISNIPKNKILKDTCGCGDVFFIFFNINR